MADTVPSKERFDVHSAVTDQIVAAIEAGAGAFVMPWHGAAPSLGRPTNAHTGLAYRGVNVVGLWAKAMTSGYPGGWWASFRQWSQLGARVRRGEQGSTVVFYRHVTTAPAAEPDEPDRSRLVARASHVFNHAQVDGWEPPDPVCPDPVRTIETVERFVSSIGATIRHGGVQACFRLDADRIEMPSRERFVGSPTSSASEAYHSTLLHELTHWSGAPHRLDRTFGKRFGDAAYAMEELVAELGAAFLCADLQIANEPRPDHAAYLSAWLKVMKSDRRAIFTAAARAKDAVAFLDNLAGPPFDPGAVDLE